MAHPFTFDHEAMRLYRRDGFTILQVARRFGCSTFTASKACRGVSVRLGFPESEVYNLLAELRDLIRESDRRERYDLSPEVRA